MIWFAPFRVVLFSAVVAYGIATRKMMEVGTFLRRFISYVLLTGYLLAVYTDQDMHDVTAYLVTLK